MGKRAGAVVLALVALGAAGGYAFGTLRGQETVTFTDATPIVAVSPSHPVDPVEVLPDPDFPVLRPGLDVEPARVGTGPFDLSLPVPEEWAQSSPTAGEWRWYPPPGQVLNTHFLRVRLISNQHQPIAGDVDARLAALRAADEVRDFTLVSRTAHGFVAEYVNDGYRRIAMESYVAAGGSDTAFAWIALVGRESDREGMADLFDRVVAGVRAPAGS